MALVMDLLAALLSGGLTTREIGIQGGDEYGLSQVFFALDVTRPAGAAAAQALVTSVLDDLHASTPVDADERCPLSGRRRAPDARGK